MEQTTPVIYGTHDCGGNIIDAKPGYVPIGDDGIIRHVDQTCDKCGAAIIGPHQKTTIIHNKKLHDKLMEFYRTNLHSQSN